MAKRHFCSTPQYNKTYKLISSVLNLEGSPIEETWECECGLLSLWRRAAAGKRADFVKEWRAGKAEINLVIPVPSVKELSFNLESGPLFSL